MIYFYHIQRTGGRSLTRSILWKFPDPSRLWHRCHGSEGEGPVVECEGEKILPWHANPIRDADDFWYSWGHVPAHKFELPDHCFTITILRDPVARFISYYRYLRKFDYIDASKIAVHFNPHLYLRSNILDTVNAFPPIHRYQMLYHFSPELDVDKAVEWIKRLSYWFRMESYAEGLENLRRLLGLLLPEYHEVDGNIPQRTDQDVAAELTPEVRNHLVQIFQPEYELLEKLK